MHGLITPPPLPHSSKSLLIVTKSRDYGTTALYYAPVSPLYRPAETLIEVCPLPALYVCISICTHADTTPAILMLLWSDARCPLHNIGHTSTASIHHCLLTHIEDTIGSHKKYSFCWTFQTVKWWFLYRVLPN